MAGGISRVEWVELAMVEAGKVEVGRAVVVVVTPPPAPVERRSLEEEEEEDSIFISVPSTPPTVPTVVTPPPAGTAGIDARARPEVFAGGTRARPGGVGVVPRSNVVLRAG